MMPDVLAAVQAFRPDVYCVVDWSAYPAYQVLQRTAPSPAPPLVYLNYRVFTRTETGEGRELVKRWGWI